MKVMVAARHSRVAKDNEKNNVIIRRGDARQAMPRAASFAAQWYIMYEAAVPVKYDSLITI